MNSTNNAQKKDEEILEDDFFTLDDEKFNTKFKAILKEQEKIKIWVEPIEDNLKLLIKNGSISKKLIAIIQFKQFKQLQKLGADSSVDKIISIIPDIDIELAKQLNNGLIQNASSESE